jgi:hypothetical protein
MFVVLMLLSVGCTPKKYIELGNTFTEFGSTYRVLNAERRPYQPDKTYEVVHLWLEITCEPSNSECYYAGADFELFDTLENRVAVSLFYLPNTEYTDKQGVTIIKTSRLARYCLHTQNLVLRYKNFWGNDGEVVYFKLPDAAQCNK